MTLKPYAEVEQKAQIPAWSRDTKPLYDIHKTWEDNHSGGPYFKGEIPQRKWAPETQWIDFLGFKVASRIGVASGPLLNSRWIELAASLGFDIVTYKTIRTHAHPSHPLPNVVPIAISDQIQPESSPHDLHPRSDIPKELNQLAITNSFGNPSRDRVFLSQDISRGNQLLQRGQVQIVSVFGVEHDGISLIDDFVDAAVIAKTFGADIIEANFSCPNLTGKGGSLYSDSETVFQITSAITAALQGTPLILKMGVMPSVDVMKESLTAAARGGAQAVCGINTIGMNVVNKDGTATLGQGRKRSGICGFPIRHAALEFIKQAREINDRDHLDLTIMGVGGASCPEHFADFINAGADIALTATAMMWDPYLAARTHQGV